MATFTMKKSRTKTNAAAMSTVSPSAVLLGWDSVMRPACRAPARPSVTSQVSAGRGGLRKPRDGDDPGMSGNAVRSTVLALAAVLALCGTASAHDRPPDFGPNVKVFDPAMPVSQVKATVDAIAAQQKSAQFSAQRYALLFKPGTYGSAAAPLNFEVGYYTDVAGLGASPRDVILNGTADVYNQCFSDGCTALVNFWRSLSNLTIQVAGKSGCQTGEFWATSQAAPMRRVRVDGATTLMDYCSAPSFASGGFIADSQFTKTIINGSQQQYFVRDSELAGWSNPVWNQVFAGVTGAPPQSFPDPPYTTLDRNPRSREKPFLQVDANGRYSVFVPDARADTAGTSWSAGRTPGHAIPLRDFFIAKPSDSVRRINRALARGENLLFTPGIYDVDRTIEVRRPGTVVLGLGMATLTARDGAVPMVVADGSEVSGLIFDA